MAKGAGWSAILAAAAAFNNFIIFVLSLKFGIGGSTKRDKAALVIGFVGVLLWIITREATFGLIFAIAADAIGTALTLEKTFKEPESENAVTWCMAATASLCGFLAISHYNFAQTIYPAYALLGGSSLAFTTIVRRKLVKRTA